MTDYPHHERTVVVSQADRVHWGPVVAGTFVALSVLIILMLLAIAIGFGPTYDANLRADYGWGAIIWGAITAFVAFALGGYFAARWSGAMGSGRAAAHGFLVWAVGVPILVFLLGTGIGPMLGTYAAAGDGVIQATQMPAAQETAPAATVSSAAWWMLVSLAAGLIGAAALGAAGAHGPGGRRTATATTTKP